MTARDKVCAREGGCKQKYTTTNPIEYGKERDWVRTDQIDDMYEQKE